MTKGQVFFLCITIVLLLLNVLVSLFFAVRSYRKNAHGYQTIPRVLNSAGLFIIISLLVGLLMLPVWGFLGFATYDRAAEAQAQWQQEVREAA